MRGPVGTEDQWEQRTRGGPVDRWTGGPVDRWTGGTVGTEDQRNSGNRGPVGTEDLRNNGQ